MKRSKKRFITVLLLFFVLVYNLSTYLYSFSEYVSKMATTETGIYNNIITINDMEADYNYYMGLNYVSSDGTLPTIENKNLYNTNNLVELKITYYGKNIENNATGYVSLSEQQDTFIYYKMYNVNNNGTTAQDDDYIEVELIDNPFSDRPNDKVFNGWTTDYKGVKIKIDTDYYVRYAKVPVAYVDNVPTPITISFYANWKDAKVGYVNSNSTWASAFSQLDDYGIHSIGGQIPIYESVVGLYLQYHISFGSSYPSGAVTSNGSSAGSRCNNFFNGCTYYLEVEEGASYDPAQTYYKLSGNGNNRNMTEHEVTISGYDSLPYLDEGTILSGYFNQVDLTNANVEGYYSSEGVIQGSSICSSNCMFYELIPYYDDFGNVNRATENTVYYYLATRDTNIIVMNANLSSKWSSDQNKPFTLTGIHNNTDYDSVWSISNQYITCYADTRIEDLIINSQTNSSSSNPSSSATSTKYIYANYYNLKIGRGISQQNSYKTFNGVYGGNNNTDAIGSASAPVKYKLTVESGFYNTITLTNGPSNTNRTKYIEAKGVYGSDYDRVSNQNTLDVFFEAAGSWGAGNYYASTNTGITFDTVIKSGNFGTGKSDHTTGVYVGGRSYGTHYTSRRIKVEGGWIYNLIGGPLTASNRGNINDTYIYMTGGSVDMITGGAGTSTTYGNRIVSVTGGTVNYSVFGGSNSYEGGSSDGKLTGSSFVYVGGNATIGNQDYVNNNSKLWGAESGSVFGIGNGNSSASTIGTNENSNIVIDGDCKILSNVYGGGNYSATGIGSSKSTTTTNIKILGGTVSGSIYGGGNNNGSGSSSISSTINMSLQSGVVNGSIYGGAKATGTIYGDVNLDIDGGTVNGSIYGGGQGNSTYITKNVDITVGNSSSSVTPTLMNNVYGGSELGTVNGTDTASEYKTNITINKGKIYGSIFGGAKGDSTYSPRVFGDVLVTVNNGDIANIFGANDNSGSLAKTTAIYLKGGKITSVYGGGNKVSQGITNVYLEGSEVTNIFGGSNESGDVNTANITVTGGIAQNIYGGNNIGGVTTTSIIKLNGGKVNTTYGGGNKTALTTSNITLDGAETGYIFGGSNESGDVGNSNISVVSGTSESIYGGNNIGGNTGAANIVTTGGQMESVYGGGKLTDTTITNITVNDGSITYIYGGGEEASAPTTNVTINKGTVDNIFGGSNESGYVEDSTINIKAGTIINLYGGNNTGGTTTNSYLNIDGGTVNTVYGGGNNASTTASNIDITDGTFENVYGGGNDTNGVTSTTSLNLSGGSITNLFGGGNKATTTSSTIEIKGSTVQNLFGGGNQSGIDDTTINLHNGTIENVFGGSNVSGNVITSEIKTSDGDTSTSELEMTLNYSAVAVNPSWQDTNYNSVVTIDVTIKNNGLSTIEEYDAYIKSEGSTLYSNYSATTVIENNGVYTFDEINKYDANNPNKLSAGGSYTFQFTIYSTMNADDFEIVDYGVSGYDTNSNSVNSDVKKLKVSNLYGGNNLGGVTDTVTINLNKGIYDNIYGGGNQAVLNSPSIYLENVTVSGMVYGGGNQALVTNDTNLTIKNCTVGTIFGGGNAGSVGKNTNIYVSSSKILESVYAGGNGTTAIVSGNTYLDIDDNTEITKHVFGGGNAANTGSETLQGSTTLINIAGANIGGNVYGGGNTSVVYGNTKVNIGYDTLTKDNLIKSDVIIGGTVFGGGEANEQGSENYDYSFISVTKGTNLSIDGNGHNELTIKTSIFGSGNASSTEGYSSITISNYGTLEDYKSNISIQRADLVTINNSVIELIGATDRTNEYSTVLFSLSRIKHLKLKNSSSLYLNTGANLLEEMTSAVDIDGVETLQTVTFEDDKVIKNVDNKIFIKGSKNLNIATNENATAYGRVNGMTFFGMFTKDRNGALASGIYGNYTTGDTPNSDDVYLFDAGSYVLGIHKTNHNITVDGFYSNFVEDGLVKVDYIKPTPEDSTYYMWSIGEQVVTMEITLTASKYLTLGAEELGMLNYSAPNTTFSIVGFNYNNLNPNVNLLEESDIPRIADTTTEADNNMSLVMKSTNSGWITKGSTSFLTGAKTISGTTFYKSENSTDVPTFQFYVYHSKNLGSSGNLGSVTISFVVTTPVDDISNKVERVNLTVNLNRELYNTNDYEASMTNGKEYSLFASTNVNLTTNGSLSAYYSLFVEGSESVYKEGYHRSLVSTYVLPVNTKLTLVNLNDVGASEYYYYVVTEEDYQKSLQEYTENKEASYDFSRFIRMGSTSSGNNYDDELNNTKYYDSNTNISFEEFIVIVDFAESNINEDVLNQSLLIELRNGENQTVVSVLGIEQERMVYSLYADSEAVVDVEGAISSAKVYPGKSVTLKVTTNFNRQIVDSKIIYDTNYFDQQLGIKITYVDSQGNQVTGASLLGVTYEYDGITYYPRMDGSVRIRLAETMANVVANIIINTTESVATGEYTMVIESFGSPDGIYYGGVSSDTDTLPVNILNTVYGLSLSMGDYLLIRDKDTGNNLNNNNDFRFNVKYSSGLINPSLRISLYRRKYDTIYSSEYELIDLQEYINETLTSSKKTYEYLLADSPLSDITYSYTLKDKLTTGTYKFVLSLYDNETYIGDVYKYIIIKERYNE